MKSRLNIASYKTLFLSLTCSAVLIASAEQACAQNAPSRIAVIDIKYIVDNHVRYEQDREGLKVHFEKKSTALNSEREAILKMEAELKKYKINSAEHVALEEKIQRAKAEWTLKANKLKKEFNKSEAQLLWNVYYEIKTETKRHCDLNGIGLVIQFNGDPIDSQQLQAVVVGVNRPIVYNNQKLDITPIILGALNPSPGPNPNPRPVNARLKQGVPR